MSLAHYSLQRLKANKISWLRMGIHPPFTPGQGWVEPRNPCLKYRCFRRGGFAFLIWGSCHSGLILNVTSSERFALTHPGHITTLVPLLFWFSACGTLHLLIVCVCEPLAL